MKTTTNHQLKWVKNFLLIALTLATISFTGVGQTAIQTATNISKDSQQGRSGDFHTVTSVYSTPAINDGDTIHVAGYYTNPDSDLLLEHYVDILRDEVFPPHSYLILEGVIPDVDAWDGGYIFVIGNIRFEENMDAFHPEDSLVAIINVLSVETFTPAARGNGSGLRFQQFDQVPDQKTDEDIKGQRADCDSCKFAVLISGGVNAANNHQKYWENLVALYNYKKDHENYCEHNIFVHYYHGVRRDNRIPQGRVSKADSAGIHDSHIEISKRVAECTKNGKEATFQKMVTNHGSANGDIDLLGNNTLKVNDLMAWQQPIIDSCCSTVKDEFLQCYGGHSVDGVSGLDAKNKATIYGNSAADKTSGFSNVNNVHSYLRAKIDSLIAGKPYGSAVVSAKMAYDAYLQGLINRTHNLAMQWRNVVPGIYNVNGVPTNITQEYINQQITELVSDSTDMASGICKSRNVTITPMKEYCEWMSYVVPPGGQLVIDFKGSRKGCGNVTVYREDPVTGQKVKVRVWNWNLPGSLRYAPGNSQRVINGDLTNPTTFWIHNDNGEFAMTVSANGNQSLPESVSNIMQYPGFSFGGTDNSAGEFMVIPGQPFYYINNIDQIPISLMQLPAYMGPGFPEYFGMSFAINLTDVLWTNMQMQIIISQVLQPGELHVFSDNSSVGFAIAEVTEPGTYLFPMADMTFGGPNGSIFMAVPNIGRASQALIVIDSWGFTSTFDTDLDLNNLTVHAGESVCYDALGYITTGGNGTIFIVESNSSVELAAGQGILMLDRTSVAEGAYLHAFIVPGGLYCSPPVELMATEVNEDESGLKELTPSESETFFKVFPNPTTGQFTLEINGVAESSGITVEIFSMIGALLIKQEVTGTSFNFDLSDKPRGIYIIRVLQGSEMEVQKVVKQ